MSMLVKSKIFFQCFKQDYFLKGLC